MSAHEMAFQKTRTGNGHQNGHPDHGLPTLGDHGKMKRIEKENFHLRRKLEEKETSTNTIKQILSTVRSELVNIKDKNLQLELERTKLLADGNERKIKNACRRLNVTCNKKIHEIQKKLESSEKKLESVKSENKKLKRKLSSECEFFDGIMERKRQKSEEKCELIRQLENKLENEREKSDVQNGKLLSALDKLEKYETKISAQNGLIEELKCKANLLEPALQENQKLLKWCAQSEKIIQNLEHANKKDKLKIKKLQRRCIQVKGKQEKVEGILEERNQLIGFIHEVCAISRFPEKDNIALPIPIPIANRTPVVTQHAEDVARRRSVSGQGCGSRAKYFCKCGKIETSWSGLQVHIKQSSPDRHFKCPKCPSRFLHLGHLKSHMANGHLMPHALDKFVIGCKSCGEMFETREKYKQHQIAHM